MRVKPLNNFFGGGGKAVAENFVCRKEFVFFSNGATESLFEAWKRLALADDQRPGMTGVAVYLQWRLDYCGPGGRAFGMDREFLPDELSAPAESTALLALVEQTAIDPTQVPDVNWSPELLEWWREQLTRLVEALRIAVEPPNQ